MVRPLLLLLCAGALTACGEADLTRYAVLPHGFEQQWKLLPHRLSLLELRLGQDSGVAGWRFTAQNNGGPFGAIDTSSARVNYALVTGSAFRVHQGALKVYIPPGQDGQTHNVSINQQDLELDNDWEAAPILRGYRLSTSDYASPPPWAGTYDPGSGFTSTGFGVRVHDLQRAGGQVSFSVSVTNRLAPCDRDDPLKKDDMNGAIPKAGSWITVFYSVVSLPRGQATSGRLQYFLNYPQFASNGVHMEQPAAALRTLTLRGQPGLASAVVALQGFDLLSNHPQQKDPSCTIRQKPGCAGAGRYIRTIRARADLRTYDAIKGEGEVVLDMMYNNDSPDGFKAMEAGSMCVRAEAEVLLLQLSGATVEPGLRVQVEELKSGDRADQAVGVCAQMPANIICP